MITPRQRGGSDRRLFVRSVEEDFVDGRALERPGSKRRRNGVTLGQDELRVPVHAQQCPRSELIGRRRRPKEGV